MNREEEIEKCKKDFKYFVENYCLVKHNEKTEHIFLHEWQNALKNKK